MIKCFYYTRRWFYWAYGGGSILVLSLWVQVQLTVAINTWYGGFYDLLQNADKYSDDPQSGITLFYDKLISIKYFTQSGVEPSFLVRGIRKAPAPLDACCNSFRLDLRFLTMGWSVD